MSGSQGNEGAAFYVIGGFRKWYGSSRKCRVNDLSCDGRIFPLSHYAFLHLPCLCDVLRSFANIVVKINVLLTFLYFFAHWFLLRFNAILYSKPVLSCLFRMLILALTRVKIMGNMEHGWIDLLTSMQKKPRSRKISRSWNDSKVISRLKVKFKSRRVIRRSVDMMVLPFCLHHWQWLMPWSYFSEDNSIMFLVPGFLVINS